MSYKLILRSKNSPFTGQFSDINLGSVLSHADLDNNFINLKGNLVYTGKTSGTTLTMHKVNGDSFDVDLSGLITAGDTFVSGATIQTGYTGDTLVLTRTDGGTVSVDLSISMTYTNSNPTLVDVGGVEAGSTFNTVPLQDMWTDLLYPELTPKFTSFDLSGVGTVVEVGFTIASGAQTLTWSTSNSAFIQPNTVRIRDISSPYTFVTGSTNDGIEVVTFPSTVQKTWQSSHTWRIDADRLNTTNFYRNHTISWRWRKYWGEDTRPTLVEAEIKTGLTNSNLSTTEVAEYQYAGGGYKYLVYPDAWGSPNLFKDAATNLQVAMADNSDGYGTLSNGYYYNTLTITNQYSIPTTYRIYRTKNQLGGPIDIIVT